MVNQLRFALVCVAAAIAASLAFPPFHYNDKYGVVRNMGHHFFLDIPERTVATTASINPILLLVQLIGLASIAGILALAFRAVEPAEQVKA